MLVHQRIVRSGAGRILGAGIPSDQHMSVSYPSSPGPSICRFPCRELRTIMDSLVAAGVLQSPAHCSLPDQGPKWLAPVSYHYLHLGSDKHTSAFTAAGRAFQQLLRHSQWAVARNGRKHEEGKDTHMESKAEGGPE